MSTVEGQTSPDSFSPNYLTVDPNTGAIGANFTGVVHAKGLNLDLAGASPGAPNEIRWLDAGGNSHAYIWANVSGAGPTYEYTFGLQDPGPGVGDPLAWVQMQFYADLSPGYNQISWGVSALTNDTRPLVTKNRNTGAVTTDYKRVGGGTLGGSSAASSFDWGLIPLANFPPTGSPNFGDTVDVIFTNGISQTVIWSFIYDAGIDATYPWQWKGGPPVLIPNTTYSTWNANAWTPFNGNAWGVQRKGIYYLSGGFSGYNNLAATDEIGGMVSIAGGAYSNFGGEAVTNTPAGEYFTLALQRYPITCPNGPASGGDTIALAYFISAIPQFVYQVATEIIPLRIG